MFSYAYMYTVIHTGHTDLSLPPPPLSEFLSLLGNNSPSPLFLLSLSLSRALSVSRLFVCLFVCCYKTRTLKHLGLHPPAALSYPRRSCRYLSTARRHSKCKLRSLSLLRAFSFFTPTILRRHMCACVCVHTRVYV